MIKVVPHLRPSVTIWDCKRLAPVSHTLHNWNSEKSEENSYWHCMYDNASLLHHTSLNISRHLNRKYLMMQHPFQIMLL
jgi:hypothetical protein